MNILVCKRIVSRLMKNDYKIVVEYEQYIVNKSE